MVSINLSGKFDEKIYMMVLNMTIDQNHSILESSIKIASL